MSPDPGREPEGQEQEPLVVHDRRRFDPATGALREQPPAAAEPAGAGQPAPADVEEERDPVTEAVAELTTDLQRVTAEYANYRKRVDRDRLAVVEVATAGLLTGLLPVLDDIDRAREHGDLTGAFKGVGEAVEGVAARLGLERFGEPGEPFDPSVHEALMQAEPDPAATVATCAAVLQPGYRLAGGRVLRPARVSVAEPGAAAPPGQPAAEPPPNGQPSDGT